MARILPPQINKDNPSRAEKRLFRLFKELEGEYVVFHSLGLADHQEKVFGEIDFVVIAHKGILCLEVKGGRLERNNGVWYHIDGNNCRHASKEDPFNQVIGAMHSLRNYVGNQLGNSHKLFNCLYAPGVMFPDIEFKEKGPEIIEEIIFDRQYPQTKKGLKKYIEDTLDCWRSRLQEKKGFQPGSLTDNGIKLAENFLRGDFGIIPSMKTKIDRVDKRLVELTEEQYKILNIAGQNERMVISGKAGTGKTLLGLEQARRNAVKEKEILLLFFNKLITARVKRKVEMTAEDLSGRIDVMNSHDLLFRVVEKYHNLEDYNFNDSDFFENTLPDKFLQCVDTSDWQNKYDLLIMDEGQDLIRENYLLCLDQMLKGGLEAGRWMIFYDPAQNIYNDEFNSGLEILEGYNPTVLKLDVNCRNTKEIGNCNTRLTKFSAGGDFLVEGGEEGLVDPRELPPPLVTPGTKREKIRPVLKGVRGTKEEKLEAIREAWEWLSPLVMLEKEDRAEKEEEKDTALESEVREALEKGEWYPIAENTGERNKGFARPPVGLAEHQQPQTLAA